MRLGLHSAGLVKGICCSYYVDANNSTVASLVARAMDVEIST